MVSGGVGERGSLRQGIVTIVMHSGLASLPKRMTTRRVSSARMAWSTCQAVLRWSRNMEPMVVVRDGVRYEEQSGVV